METVRLILLIAHILGFSALIGGLLAQAGPGDKKVTGVMRDGVGTAFLAGLLLVGVLEGMDGVEVNHAKVAVKLVIGLVLLVGAAFDQARDQAVRFHDRALPARVRRARDFEPAAHRAAVNRRLAGGRASVVAALHADRHGRPSADHSRVHHFRLLHLPRKGAARRGLSLGPAPVP